jgi:hypothetical protein
MIPLTYTGTDKLQLITDGAQTLDVQTSYIDYLTTTSPLTPSPPSRTNTEISSATTTDIIATPSQNYVRVVKGFTVRNHDTTPNVVTVQYNANGTLSEMRKTFLYPGCTLQWSEDEGFDYLGTPDGSKIVMVLDSDFSTPADLTAYVAIPDFSFPFGTNEKWYLKYFGLHQSAANTTGFGLALNTSVSVTTVTFQTFHQLANSGTVSGGSSIADSVAVGVSSGLPSATTNVPVMGAGILLTSSTVGSGHLMMRAEANAVTTVKAGSILIARRIV